MKKLESSLLNMVLVLTLITAIVAVALGGMEALTHDPIEQAKKAKQEQAIKDVLPEYATLGEVENVEGVDLYRAFDKNNELVGIAVKVTEPQGFGGPIDVMVGFDKQGNVFNYSILAMSETPGLGSKLDMWFKEKSDIRGTASDATPYTVSKDGGEFDAITAATISSRAFLRAMTLAANTYQLAVGNEVSEDAKSAATEQAGEWDAEKETNENN